MKPLHELPVEELHIAYKSPEWYALRRQGIGGSDAAAILGLNPWKSNLELWQEKVGEIEPSTESNDLMLLGTEAEEPIVRLFSLEHPQYDVIDFKESVFKRGFQIASIDAGLVEKETGRKGGLEIKYTTPMSRRAWDEWDSKIPEHYYPQVIHYLSTTSWDFWILRVRFRSFGVDGEIITSEKEYRFEREQVKDDIQVVEEHETTFWKSVEERKRPGVKLPLV